MSTMTSPTSCCRSWREGGHVALLFLLAFLVLASFAPVCIAKTHPNRTIASPVGAMAAQDLAAATADSTPSGPVIDQPGCEANVLPANDDDSTEEVELPFELNFFGSQYSGLWVNNNGNVTFDGPMEAYIPFDIGTTTRSMIAPFFADVDTRGAESGLVTYGTTTFEGRTAFCVDWLNVGYYAEQTDKLNEFQLLLVDRSDVAPGDFDIVFNYGRILWETGEAGGGSDGLGGVSASAGFSNGDGVATHFYQLPGSLESGALLDSDQATGLVNNDYGTSIPGRYRFHMVEGQEFNVSNSEMYGGSNPAQLTDTDCMSGDPVNCATGDLVEDQRDLTVGGLGPGLSATRTYNSQLAATEEEPGAFGWGWTGAYEDAVEVKEKCIAGCEEDVISSMAKAEDAEGGGEEPSSGPIVAYSFDEGEGKVAGDSAGGHDGSIQHARWTSGKFGPALNFNSNDSRGSEVWVPPSPELEITGPFTIDAWVRPTQSQIWAGILFKQAGTNETYGLEAGGSESGVPSGFVGSGGELEEVNATEPLPVDTWSNLALVFDGEEMRLYVDGALVGTAPASPPEGGSGPLRIGTGLIGKTDEVRLYDRALDAEEIHTDEATPIGTTEGAEGPGEFEEEKEIWEEAAVVHQANGSTAEFRRIQGETTWVPANPLIRATLVSEEEGYSYTLPDQTVLHFGSSGRLTSEEDENGNVVTIDPGPEGEIASVCDESGRELVYSYNSEGLVQSIEDPMGHTVHFEYEDGNLVSVSHLASVEPKWQFAYDREHELTSVTDARGGVTRTRYAFLRVIEQQDPMARVTRWAYEPQEEESTTTITEPNGSETVEQFDQNGLVGSVIRGAGTALSATTTYEYNTAEELTSVTNPEEETTEFTYGPNGDKIGETDPEGNETTWTYNGAHELTSETKPGGEKTTIARDADGDPETVSRPAPESKAQTVSYEYGPHGEVESVTDPLGATWSYGYDKYGDRISETDPEGDERVWVYNEDSQMISKVSPRGNEEGAEASEFTTSIERDPQGRPVKIIDPLGGSTELVYDADGNVESITDPNGHETMFTYNADNELTKVERPNGDVEETGYDGAGQVTSQTDGNKQKTTYVRNVLEQPIEIIDPLERKTTQTFDAAGNLLSIKDPEGRTTSYSYDKANRLKEISYSAEPGQDATFSYDKDGNLTGMTDGTGESSYEYDQLDRLTHSKDGHGETVSWEYNLGNEPVGLTYPNGKSISRAYDKAGRLESVTDWLGHTTTFAYNKDSEPTATTFPTATGDKDEYAYDRADRMSGVTMKKGAETLASLAYSRDPAGQLESLISKGLPGAETESFSYDENERLTKAGGAEFGYDAANNITKAPGTANAYDKASEIESATGAAFTFDKEGERTKETPSSGPATTYKYSQAGELTAVERPEEGETPAISESFGYDGNGLMASRTVGLSTAHFVWDPTESSGLLLSDGADSYVFGPGGLPFEQISSEEVPTYIHHDQLGSTRLLTNSSGEATGTFTYGAYGALTGHTGTATTALGYAGQYTLGQSGLQYLRARFYDPATAQFLTLDPLASITRAPYLYAGDNPANRRDRTGRASESAEGGCPSPTCFPFPTQAEAESAGAAIGGIPGEIGEFGSEIGSGVSSVWNSVFGGDESSSEEADGEASEEEVPCADAREQGNKEIGDRGQQKRADERFVEGLERAEGTRPTNPFWPPSGSRIKRVIAVIGRLIGGFHH